MKRLVTAPNLALATLWADMLTHGGFPTVVQRAYASGISGEIPPDQACPELWLSDDAHDPAAARTLLEALRSAPARLWVCRACGERVEGPFEQCWNCGAAMPA